MSPRSLIWLSQRVLRTVLHAHAIRRPYQASGIAHRRGGRRSGRGRPAPDTILVMVALLALLVAPSLVSLATSPWPPLVTLRHWAAAPNCDAARRVGLAPARRGEPGYYPRHDRDNDGIACEPWSRRRR